MIDVLTTVNDTDKISSPGHDKVSVQSTGAMLFARTSVDTVYCHRIDPGFGPVLRASETVSE